MNREKAGSRRPFGARDDGIGGTPPHNCLPRVLSV